MEKKETKAIVARFSESESTRYSEIQNLACEHLCSEPGADWIECVARATRKVDGVKG